MVAEII